MAKRFDALDFLPPRCSPPPTYLTAPRASYADDEDGDTSTAQTPSPLASASTASSSVLLTPQLQSSFLRTPPEILHKVLLTSCAEDFAVLARAAKTCRELRSFIYGNPDQALWRDLHLACYDDPRKAGCFVEPRSDFNWKQRVQERGTVERIFREWDEDRYDELPRYMDLIMSTLTDMYLDLPPLPSSSSSALAPPEESLNAEFLSMAIRTPLFNHIYMHLSTRETRAVLRPLPGQAGNPNRKPRREVINPHVSRLHALLSPDFDMLDEAHVQHRGNMREVVYTGANFTERNDWAPLDSEGKVDWRLVDAIGCVMMSNAKDVLAQGEESWRKAVEPLSYGIEPARGWGFSDLRRPAELGPDDVWDWVGVEGLWCGSYAFLDYADWILLNEHRLVQLRRQASDLDLTNYAEAIGDLMRLELFVDRPSSSSRSSSSSSSSPCPCTTRGRTCPLSPSAPYLQPVTTPLPTSDLLPPLHFHGSSKQHHGHLTFPSNTPESSVRGVVRLTADTPEPQVRWTLVIHYGGEDRWRLECVQVGGRGSKRGFFGVWTDALKEEHSPNGPVWYWKP